MPESLTPLQLVTRKFEIAWRDVRSAVPEIVQEGLKALREEPHPFRVLSRMVQNPKGNVSLFAVLLTGAIDETPRTFRSSFCRRWITRHFGEDYYFPPYPGPGKYFIETAWKLQSPADLFSQITHFLGESQPNVVIEAIEAFFWFEYQCRRMDLLPEFGAGIDAWKDRLASRFLEQDHEALREAIATVIGRRWVTDAGIAERIEAICASPSAEDDDIYARIHFLFPLRGTPQLSWEDFKQATEAGKLAFFDAIAHLETAGEADWDWFRKALQNPDYDRFCQGVLSGSSELPADLVEPLIATIFRTRRDAKNCLRMVANLQGPGPVLRALEKFLDEHPDQKQLVGYFAYYVCLGMQVWIGDSKISREPPDIVLKVQDFDSVFDLKVRLGGGNSEQASWKTR